MSKQLCLSLLLYVLTAQVQGLASTTTEISNNPSNTNTQDQETLQGSKSPGTGSSTPSSIKDKTKRFVPREKVPADSAVSFPADI
ncbi:MAG: hypothetical protein ABFS45_10300 [Pseudomonadota bacterium]